VLTVAIPGRRALRLWHLVLDVNGTLAGAGRLLPGVAPRLRRLAGALEVTVLTADTYGTASRLFAPLPVRLFAVGSGADKRRFVEARRGAVAVGNGANDEAMLRAAALGVAVIGPEGAAVVAVRAADVVVTRIADALDLFLDQRRLVATLRR